MLKVSSYLHCVQLFSENLCDHFIRLSLSQHLVAFVTGGASGLGKATVQQLARKGSQVVFCDLPTSSGHAVAKELGDNVSFVPADITKEADVHAAIGHIDNKYGRLDVLVNCAGLANAFLAYNFHKDSPRNQQDFDTVLKVPAGQLIFVSFFLLHRRFSYIGPNARPFTHR